MTTEMLGRLLAASDRLQAAVSEFQAEVEALQDFGARLRLLTDSLKETKGGLDDTGGVIKLPALLARGPAKAAAE